MKLLKQLSLLILLICTTAVCAQKSIQLTEDSDIRDENGNKISMTEMTSLLKTDKYTLRSETDENGVSHFKIKELDEKTIIEMQELKARTAAVNENFPTYNFTDIEGNLISSTNTLGKVVVFNFWFAACKPCIEEIPDLNKVYEKYNGNSDVIFAAITFDELEKVTSFVKKYELKYPAVAAQNDFSKEVTGGSYPTNIVLDKDGKVVVNLLGGRSDIETELIKAIDKGLMK